MSRVVYVLAVKLINEPLPRVSVDDHFTARSSVTFNSSQYFFRLNSQASGKRSLLNNYLFKNFKCTEILTNI